MKDNIKSVVVLSVICLVVAAVLAGCNFITAPIIKENARLKEQESLRAVLPDSVEFKELSIEGAFETVTGIYEEINGKGYAVTLETTSSYSKSPMTFTLGVSAEGKIVGVEITNYSETKDFGDYPTQFVGKDASLDGVDITAGVTYSSNAFKDAVKDAFAAIEEVAGK